jgi:diguanylate cyclase (GGDEF)-like protein
MQATRWRLGGVGALGLVLGLALGLVLGIAKAQAPRPVDPPLLFEPHFETLGDGASIPDGVVSTLGVDPQGMVWIGTSVGLVRFDGHSFTPVALNAPDRRTGGTTFIRALLAARDGRIWLGTESEGLSVYDPVADRWQVHRHTPRQPDSLAPGVIRTLAEDRSGRIWVGFIGGGLQMLDPASGRFRTYGAAQGLPDPRVQHVSADADGNLWVGTWNGVAVLPAGAERLSRPKLPDGQAFGLEGQVVLALAPMPDGSVWVGTQDGALWQVPRTVGSPRRLDDGPSTLGAVQAISRVSERQVWIGRAAGIEIRQPDDGRLQRALRPHIAKPWGLAGADIRSLVRDPGGVLWVGGYGSGLQRVNTLDEAVWVRRPDADPQSVMARPDVRSLLVLRDGSLWAGTSDGGIALLDAQLRTVGAIPSGQQGLGPGRVAALAQAPDGRVWAGAEARVLVFAHARAVAQSYAVGPGRVRRLLADRDGAIWAGTQDGLYRLAPTATAFVRVQHHDGRPLTGDVNALVQATDGTVWVGAETGLYPVPAGSDRLARIAFGPDAGLVNPNVLGLLLDRGGRLWVDTTAGLHRLRDWDGRTAQMEYLGHKLAQATHTVPQAFGANLLEDERGRIWTQRGVYDPREQRLHVLSSADGVDIGTAWFRSYAQTLDGRLLFGGSRGVLVVQPRDFQPSRFEPPVVATGLRVGAQERPLSQLQPRLLVGPSDGGFTLEFAALDLSEPARNRFRYRLLGHDGDWIETSSRTRQASYGGLAPGRYTLQVQGSNRNGDWSSRLLIVDVEVQPAWWQAWWGRLLMVAGVLLGTLGLSHWRTRVLRQRQSQLEARVAEATRALEAKTRELEDSALTDPLTGLRNRRFVVQRLDDDLRLVRRQFEEAQRRGAPPPSDADLSFVMIDIDHFKHVNDEHGHPAGDAVLVQMRERLQEVFRESDYLVRWGGEEFLVVARGTSREGLPELAERARSVVASRPFFLPDGTAVNASCSIGYACFPLNRTQPRAEHWSEVMALADAALYAAKREGRNRWVGVQSAEAAPVPELIASVNASLPDARMQIERGPKA